MLTELDVEWEREKEIKDESKGFCLTGKMHLLLTGMKKTVGDAVVGEERGVQLWTCYFEISIKYSDCWEGS